MDETLPLLLPPVRASETVDNNALDKELNQLLSGNGLTKEDDDTSKQPSELSTVPLNKALLQSPNKSLGGLSMKSSRSLPPISSSSSSSPRGSLGSLPPLTSSPLSGSAHHSSSLTLTPIETNQLKPPALQPLSICGSGNSICLSYTKPSSPGFKFWDTNCSSIFFFRCS